MRAYFVQNMYLQGIHAGIQSQHTTAEMFCKYAPGTPEKGDLYQWARHHKTTIILNGGYNYALQDFLEFLNNNEHSLAYASFNESEAALGGILTNVGIIVPPRIYNAPKDMLDRDQTYTLLSELELTEFEFQLARRLKGMRLMS